MERMVSCPTSSVMTPSDQPRLSVSTTSIAHEVRRRRNASNSRPRVSTSARTLAISPSRVAALSSSLKSAGAPGDAGLDRGKLLAEARDRAPDGEDRRVLRGEGARRVGEVDHDEEQPPVVRQEVAAVGGGGGGGEEARPGRAVRPAVDPLRHLGQEIVKQTVGRRVRLFLGAGAEDSGQERRADGLVDAIDQPVERRGGGEVGEQVFLAGDRVEGVSQRVERQVQQCVGFEAAGVDAIADARRPEGAVAEESGQAGRVGRGGLDLRALHDHDDVLELAEVLRVVLVERGVPLVEREQVELGRLERQGMRRVADAERGKRRRPRRPSAPGGRSKAARRAAGAGPSATAQSASDRRPDMGHRASFPPEEPAAGAAKPIWRDLSLATRAS